jgi:hypothetical protein
MKTWVNLSCPVCGFRHSSQRFVRSAQQPIQYPLQVVSGGGRGSGFHVLRYIPWTELPNLERDSEAWRAINCEYLQLSSAYDNFHTSLGFLSPKIKSIIESLEEEIFRLKLLHKELLERYSRQSLLVHPNDKLGEFAGLLEKTQRRDAQDRFAATELLK